MLHHNTAGTHPMHYTLQRAYPDEVAPHDDPYGINLIQGKTLGYG